MIDFGIIAAGDGNRIRQEGSFLPKPLVDIEGEPMIGRLVKIMEKAGAASINVIVNSSMPEVIGYLEFLGETLKCRLRISDRRTPSSMHTMYELLKLMEPSGKFIVTTVDTIFRKDDFNAYVESFRKSGEGIDGMMGATYYIDDEKPLYMSVDEDMRITGYLDRPFEGVKYVSAGIYGLSKKALPVLEECVELGVTKMRNFQRKLVEEGFYLKAFNLGKVIDVDHIGDIDKANKFLA